MSLINHEELKKQIENGTFAGLDDITNQFKNILKDVIQTASQEELTSLIQVMIKTKNQIIRTIVMATMKKQLSLNTEISMFLSLVIENQALNRSQLKKEKYF